MLTNCVNCGAPLHGNKCEYCGTEYSGENRERVTATFGPHDVFGTLTVGGKSYRVYLANTEIQTISGEPYRDHDGNLCGGALMTYRKFTLVGQDETPICGVCTEKDTGHNGSCLPCERIDEPKRKNVVARIFKTMNRIWG